MKYQLAHVALFSPDELLPYWFISHDFAGELGVEYSKQAAAILKKALATLGARIDYEADAVTLRISRKERVLPALEALYALLEWNKTELEALRPQVDAFKRPRPRKVSVGDIFQVPVASDLVGVGQVLDFRGLKSPTVAIFTDVSRTKLLTILHIGGSSLYRGDWPIVGSGVPIHDPASGPGGKKHEVGSVSYGGDGPIVELLKAYAGRRSWSEGFHDPQYLRKLVLP